MSKRVLVLNQDYSAFSVCSANKAFLLVYTQKAELVTEDRQSYMRTVTRHFPMPSVIRLHKYINLPYRNGVMLSRQNIFKRDGGACQYCGNPRDLTLDHVLPRSRGGKSTWDNLVTACKPCNSRKGDFTPEEIQMPLKQKPFKPSFVMFLRDFSGRLSEDWLLYLGRKSHKNEA